MDTRKLVNLLMMLRNELLADGPSHRWRAARRCALVLLRMHRGKIAYDEAKVRYGVHVEFFETDEPFSDRDRENVRRAMTVNREIRKHLSDAKKAASRARLKPMTASHRGLNHLEAGA